MIEKSKRLKQLIRFLKEHGAYKAWVRNVIEDCNRSGRSLDEKLSRLNSFALPLNCSFIYDRTPEGQIFWMFLSNAFCDEIYGKKQIT